VALTRWIEVPPTPHTGNSCAGKNDRKMRRAALAALASPSLRTKMETEYRTEYGRYIVRLRRSFYCSDQFQISPQPLQISPPALMLLTARVPSRAVFFTLEARPAARPPAPANGTPLRRRSSAALTADCWYLPGSVTLRQARLNCPLMGCGWHPLRSCQPQPLRRMFGGAPIPTRLGGSR
jgi:hypothetical protein